LTKDERKALRKEEWQEELKQEERNRLMTKVGWILGAIVIIVLAFWGIIQFTGSSQQGPDLITKMPPVTNNDLQTGSRNSKVTLTEYADFQCPGCGAYHPVVKQLLQAFNGKIHFVYRTFPLTQVHQNALAAAEAAIAASKQAKFWEMHDMLYEHQADWSGSQNPQSVFDRYAQSIGLNINQFHKDSTDAKTKKFIMDEENAGVAVGVNSTPTFFLNGKQIQTPQSFDAFKQTIQQAFSN
jgi:protein-disulfide isomerase